MTEKRVELYHPDLDAYGECMPESVVVWLDSGWTVVDDTNKEKTAPSVGLVGIDDESEGE